MQTEIKTQIKEGLEGVLVTATALSEVDGGGGHLTIAGYPVEVATRDQRFEALCAQLWSAALNETIEPHEVEKCLGKQRAWAATQLGRMGEAVYAADGMDALRTSVSFVDVSGLAPWEACARLVASTAVFSAAWFSKKTGKPLLAPSPKLPHAADYLRLALGQDQLTPALENGINAYLVCISDHGLNASTFTARVIASTASDPVSSVVGAIGALKGPLHGGAPGPVLDMLEAIGRPENAISWLESQLAEGKRIMGMGHRIYRVRDPRASALESAVENLEKAGLHTKNLALAREVERTAREVLKKRHPNRSLEANVEFYTAVLLDALGLHRSQFSPTFAVGRMAGWTAHYLEQRRTGRLIRPDSIYNGKRFNIKA
jgi:citrate synthase